MVTCLHPSHESLLYLTFCKARQMELTPKDMQRLPSLTNPKMLSYEQSQYAENSSPSQPQ
jgi:hypothetical protein